MITHGKRIQRLHKAKNTTTGCNLEVTLAKQL